MIVPTHVHTEGIATPASSKASDAAKDNKLNASVASKKQILVPTEAVKRELQQWSARPRTSRSGSKENMHQDVYDRLASNPLHHGNRRSNNSSIAESSPRPRGGLRYCTY